MEFKDYYKMLGLERSATQDEVKRAYRKLARKYHPDINKNAGAENQFKEIGEAYEVLGDPEKRSAYDQLGKSWKPGEEFRPPPDWDAGFEFSGASTDGSRDASEFFATLFGSMGRRRPPHDRAEFHARGEDHHAKILVNLRDIFDRAIREITLRAPEFDARGHVVLRERTLSVQIPKGVTEGQHIRLKGQGAPGVGTRIRDNAPAAISSSRAPRRIRTGVSCSCELRSPQTAMRAIGSASNRRSTKSRASSACPSRFWAARNCSSTNARLESAVAVLSP